MSDDAPKQVYAKTMQGFAPASDEAWRFFRRVKFGELVELPGKQPRNLKYHNLYWAMVTWGTENLEGEWTKDQLHHVLRVLSGWCDFVPDGKGGLIAVPKPTNFASADADQFDRFFIGARAALLKLLPAGCSEDMIMQALAFC